MHSLTQITAKKQFAGWIIMLMFLHCQVITTVAQVRCGTVPYTQKLHDQHTLTESRQQFEQWLREKMQHRKKAPSAGRTQAATYQVPVVVHVIHKGEPAGTGVNIPDAQILSQIDVLNKDFQRLNADAGNTPAEFLPVAGSMDIEFVLAKRTPEGLPTNGIVRVQGAKDEWTLNDNYELKSQSYWPAEDYLNIWVTDLGNSYLGYAQFPVSGLPGLENSSNNRLTDGVAIDYTAFGSVDDGAFSLDPNYNKGRTTTHEIGHFLGLRHTWGDDEGGDNCAGTDYVDDTPNQASSTNSCPTNTRTSCSSNDMYQNYLDYTHDDCMNLFTAGQVERMITIIENSPRRASLPISPGLLEPEPVADDLGIKTIVSPGYTECSDAVTPSIEIQNYGTNNIFAAEISVSRNSTPIETLPFVLDLEPGESTTVSFNPQASLSPGTHTFAFEIVSTNNTTDGFDHDNERSVDTQFPFTTTTPFSQNFNTAPADWIIDNPDQLITWQNTTAPNGNAANTAMYLNFYDYEDSEGESDMLITPVFDLSDVPSAYLSFDVAYARFPGNADGLRVYVLTGCSSNIFEGTKIYDKFGTALETAPSTSAPFTPLNAGQWRTEILSLNDFAGLESVQIAFVGVNAWGNNLYLDKVAVVTDADENLALTEVIRPTPAMCLNQVVPEIKVRNLSGDNITINSFDVEITINDDAPIVIPFGITLAFGEETTLELPDITLDDGANTIIFELTAPNGLVDSDPSDNTRLVNTTISTSASRIPLREDFEGDFAGEWILTNPGGGQPWEIQDTNYGRSVFFNGFDNTNLGDEAWLISPLLDFSHASTASVFFDLSYAFRDPYYDQLRVFTSVDCGEKYFSTVVNFNEAGSDLAVTTSSSYWEPAAAGDWTRRYINLYPLAGYEQVRLAFAFTNANGNNLYLDNFEFYTDDDEDPLAVEAPFLVYGTTPADESDFKITFNLPEQSPVHYEVVDMMGRTLAAAYIPGVLNQTYAIDAGGIATGVYIVRLRIDGDYYATRVLINKRR